MWLMLALAFQCGPETQFTPIPDKPKEVYPEGVPDIFVEQDAVDFGTIAPSGEARRPLTIKNKGGGVLGVSAITVRGSTSITIDTDEDFQLKHEETLEIDLVWSPAAEEEWDLVS